MSENIFCPLCNKQCHGNLCAFWHRDWGCLIRDYILGKILKREGLK